MGELKTICLHRISIVKGSRLGISACGATDFPVRVSLSCTQEVLTRGADWSLSSAEDANGPQKFKASSVSARGSLSLLPEQFQQSLQQTPSGRPVAAMPTAPSSPRPSLRCVILTSESKLANVQLCPCPRANVNLHLH